MLTPVVRAQQDAVISGRDADILVRERHGIKMRPGRTLLHRPRAAAIVSSEDATVSANGPTVMRIVACESYRIQMILRGCLDWSPFFAGVMSFQNQSARTHRKHSLRIQDVQAIQGVDQTRWLVLPMKPTVGRVKNHAIRTGGPSVQ